MIWVILIEMGFTTRVQRETHLCILSCKYLFHILPNFVVNLYDDEKKISYCLRGIWARCGSAQRQNKRIQLQVVLMINWAQTNQGGLVGSRWCQRYASRERENFANQKMDALFLPDAGVNLMPRGFQSRYFPLATKIIKNPETKSQFQSQYQISCVSRYRSPLKKISITSLCAVESELFLLLNKYKNRDYVEPRIVK